jgi:hypothetical protein
LVNKTSINETLNVITQADFILTHESGLYHAACIPSNKSRHIIIPAGSRHTVKSNYWNHPNITIHWLSNENKDNYYKYCFNSNEHLCLCCDIFSRIDINNTILRNKIGSNCKLPVFYNGEVLSHCLYDIKPETVIELIENILESKNDKDN